MGVVCVLVILVYMGVVCVIGILVQVDSISVYGCVHVTYIYTVLLNTNFIHSYSHLDLVYRRVLNYKQFLFTGGRLGVLIVIHIGKQCVGLRVSCSVLYLGQRLFKLSA